MPITSACLFMLRPRPPFCPLIPSQPSFSVSSCFLFNILFPLLYPVPTSPACVLFSILFPLLQPSPLLHPVPSSPPYVLFSIPCPLLHPVPSSPSQWGAADAEIKVPSGENTELKRSPFKAWSRSVHSHTCYAHYQEFLPCLFLSFRSIHPHFPQNLSRFLLCWLWPTWFLCRLAE